MNWIDEVDEKFIRWWFDDKINKSIEVLHHDLTLTNL